MAEALLTASDLLETQSAEDSTGAGESNRATAQSVSDDADQSAFNSTRDSSGTTHDESSTDSTDSSATAATGNTTGDTAGNATESRTYGTVNNGTQLGNPTDGTIAEVVGQQTGNSATSGAHDNFATGVVSTTGLAESERVGRGGSSFVACGLGSGSSGFGSLHRKSGRLNLHLNSPYIRYLPRRTVEAV